ncbi:hypothetical protein RP20_CCG015887 [Aedes albopictus]|nr:hypothetical protein RP20_CCG015887 [Aedes albopictus]
MSPSELQLAIIGLLMGTPIPAAISPKVQNYTITAIEYLSRHHPGRFECVFFDVSGANYFDSDFQELISSPRLDHVVKYVIDNSSLLSHNAGLPWFPALVVINVHGEKIDFYTDQVELNPHTRIMILVEIECKGCFYSAVRSIMLFFFTTHFTRMICIESKYRVFTRIGFNGTFTDYLEYLEPGELFQNILLDMEGRTIPYSGSVRIPLWQENWMKETARYLNATPRYKKAPCDHKLGLLSDCFPKFFLSGAVVISLDCIILDSLSPNLCRSLFEVLPYTNVFAIPMPRSINVLEMFFWPFTLTAWIVLTLIVISLELIHLANPHLFKNNPTLLIICGFERYDLHRASAREKLIFLSLIIFFFLMINAYETRIISFMIEKPSIKKIESVQELIDSGLQLAAPKINKMGLFKNEKFSGMLLDISDTPVDDLDGTNAYYGMSRYMENRIRMPANFDFKKGRPNYYILDGTDGLQVCLYWLPWYDSLMEMFGYTERIFFEAGLLPKWEKDELSDFNSLQRRWLRKKGLDLAEVEERLAIRDMLPAWIAIGVGSAGSLVVLFGELLNRRVTDRIGRYRVM